MLRVLHSPGTVEPFARSTSLCGRGGLVLNVPLNTRHIIANCNTINLVMSRRDSRSEGVQEICLVSFFIEFHQKFATSAETGLLFLSAHHTARPTFRIVSCRIRLTWIKYHECNKSLVAFSERQLLENISWRQATHLVEGMSPSGYLLVSESNLVNLGKFPASPVELGTKSDLSTLVLPAPVELTGGELGSGLCRSRD